MRSKTVFSESECVAKWVSDGSNVQTGLVNLKDHYKKGRRIFSDEHNIYSYGTHYILATELKKKKDGKRVILCNADKYSVTTSKHQQFFFKYKLPHVPFSALAPVGVIISSWDQRVDTNWLKKYTNNIYDYFQKISFQEIELIDYTHDKQEEITYINESGNQAVRWQHTPGAVLLKVPLLTDKTKSIYLLCGMDDGHYFACQLPRKAKNIEDAFASLKPKKIKEYEEKGFQILRQGDVYMVKTSESVKQLEERCKKLKIKIEKQFFVNDSHFATRGFSKDGHKMVWGIMRHQAKQHKPVKMDDGYAYIAVQNLKVAAWQSEGKID